MSDLTPEARALLELGREVSRPTEADRARSIAALRVELGAAAMDGGSRSAARTSTWKSVGLVAGSGVVAVGAVVALWLAFRAPAASQSHGLPPQPNPVVVASGSSAVVESPPAPPASLTAAPAAPPVASVPSKSERLAEEVAILARAAAYLNNGRNADALRELDQHRRRFPSGQLTEERRAARARALCALGRRDEAEQELVRLARMAAGSPNLARARQACGLASKP